MKERVVGQHTALQGGVLLPGEGECGSRRDFLRLAGFGISAAGVAAAGCSREPLRGVVSYVKAPGKVVAGRGYEMATTCGACSAGCGLLARCRDGRPLKLEGNPAHPVSRGGVCAVGQASILELYDGMRFDGPQQKGASASWEAGDAAVAKVLARAKKSGRGVRLLTGTITSPSTRWMIGKFLSEFQNARHVVYDPLSCSAIREAFLATHGARLLPRYRFEEALVIASFDADFLGTWIDPVAFAGGYARGRRVDQGHKMSRHWQFEGRMSLTGGCADERVRLAPSEVSGALGALCDLLARRADKPSPVPGFAEKVPAGEALKGLADELWAARGRSLVVCGWNDVALQTLVNEANHLLGNEGRTVDLERASLVRMGDDRQVEELLSELKQGRVEVLMVQGVNPAYDLPREMGAEEALKQAGLLISCQPLIDETQALAQWTFPEPHYLEAWDDGEPLQGLFTLTQPTVRPLRSCRTLRGSLARWSGVAGSDRALVRRYWKREIHPRLRRPGESFRAFFGRVLQAGVVAAKEQEASPRSVFRPQGVRVPPGPARKKAGGALELVLYPKLSMLEGKHAQNPWLQELADPVSRLAWESYVTLSRQTARRLAVTEGDIVRIERERGAGVLELPVHVQPGQHDQVVAVALGYGRLGTERFSGVGPSWWEAEPTVRPGQQVGVNAGPWRLFEGGSLSTRGGPVKVTPLGRHHDLATVQDQQSLEVPHALAPKRGKIREAVRSAPLSRFLEDPSGALGSEHAEGRRDLWPRDHERGGHHWGMTIDLAACTGCSACVIACQAENNIPVVGRDEVRRHREMAWLRIDRYHDGKGDDVQVSRQPILCQHCDHAPCESVCPVLATVHSEEGLNQQIYNRCVGTRFCANTCPYKVRRFNWFNYPRPDTLQRLALNPDVTVRSRGVMEKCSMCVQRIRIGEIKARSQHRPWKDGAVQTACEQSCPTRAITFGDLADPSSEVARKSRSPRAYRVLEELGVEPSIRYLALIRNRKGR